MAALSFVPLTKTGAVEPDTEITDYPFTLGVASGDPKQDSVVLWTRLAPYPLDVKAMPQTTVIVKWQICTDEACTIETASGNALAYPNNAHSVHIDVRNLNDDTTYYYRFVCGKHLSPVGRTKTLPKIGAQKDKLSFAVAACQSYTDGHYAAFRDMAERQLDLIIHTGDYIYERDWFGGVRNIPIIEADDLDTYRQLYATYKQDVLLQSAHASAPWICIWDDHEVDNDWGGKYNEYGESEEAFVKRKVAAFKAYFEHMPLRFAARPQDGKVQLHQRIAVGNLIQFDLLDCRQYRDMPACEHLPSLLRSYKSICDEAMASSRSMLGADQESWLLRGLGYFECKWNAIVQTTMLAPFDYLNGKSKAFDMDGWDNFASSRQKILDEMKIKDLSNPLSFGGNIHAFYAGVVNEQALNHSSTALLTELVCGSISSGGGGDDRYCTTNQQFSENPFAHYFENRYRGYLLCELTHEQLRADLQIVDDIYDPQSKVTSLHNLIVKDGQVGFD